MTTITIEVDADDEGVLKNSIEVHGTYITELGMYTLKDDIKLWVVPRIPFVFPLDRCDSKIINLLKALAKSTSETITVSHLVNGNPDLRMSPDQKMFISLCLECLLEHQQNLFVNFLKGEGRQGMIDFLNSRRCLELRKSFNS